MLDSIFRPIFLWSTPKCLRIGEALRDAMPSTHIVEIGSPFTINKLHHVVFIRGLWDSHIEKIQELKRNNIRFVTVDNGYFKRDPHGGMGYYRFTWGEYQQSQIYDRNSSRWDNLNLQPDPWQDNPDGPIIVCPPSPQICKLYNMDVNTWIRVTQATIKRKTNNEIIFRDKPRMGPKQLFANLKADIQGARCLVTHDSIAAVEAVLFGIPVITSQNSAAAPIGLTNLNFINNLVRPKRKQWLYSLAFGQFSLSEVRHGLATAELFAKYKEDHSNVEPNSNWMG